MPSQFGCKRPHAKIAKDAKNAKKEKNQYHYWYHTGENMAIRQLLGHARLGVFVGNIDDKASYRAE